MSSFESWGLVGVQIWLVRYLVCSQVGHGWLAILGSGVPLAGRLAGF